MNQWNEYKKGATMQQITLQFAFNNDCIIVQIKRQVNWAQRINTALEYSNSQGFKGHEILDKWHKINKK